MKKVFKWIGIVLGSLVGLILVLAAVFYFMGNARLNKCMISRHRTLSFLRMRQASNMANIASRVYVRVAMGEVFERK